MACPTGYACEGVALVSGRRHAFVQTGTYNEVLVLTNNVSIWGGYDVKVTAVVAVVAAVGVDLSASSARPARPSPMTARSTQAPAVRPARMGPPLATW